MKPLRVFLNMKGLDPHQQAKLALALSHAIRDVVEKVQPPEFTADIKVELEPCDCPTCGTKRN